MIIVGARSLIGTAVAQLCEARGRPWLGTDKTAADGYLPFDLRTDTLSRMPIPQTRVMRAMNDPALVLTAGITPIDTVATHPGSWAVNVEGTIRTIKDAVLLGYRVVWLSSSYVFSGQGPHKEADVCEPHTTYGRQKRAVELAVLDMPRACILRFDKVIGPGTVLAPFAQRFTPMRVESAADAILRACDEELTGIYHVAGEAQERPVRPMTLFMVESRPADTRLDSTRFRDRTGWKSAEVDLRGAYPPAILEQAMN